MPYEFEDEVTKDMWFPPGIALSGRSHCYSVRTIQLSHEEGHVARYKGILSTASTDVPGA